MNLQSNVNAIIDTLSRLKSLKGIKDDTSDINNSLKEDVQNLVLNNQMTSQPLSSKKPLAEPNQMYPFDAQTVNNASIDRTIERMKVIKDRKKHMSTLRGIK